MKRYLPYFIIASIIALVIIGFSLKGKMNSIISKKMKEQVTVENALSVEQAIQTKYNYVENGLKYDFTFLEFSSTGCTVCKQMEPVLEEVRNSDKANVNVVFLHIMKSENIDMLKFYGISAVPMQVLLDRQGNEFYRHYGYISADEILVKASSVLTSN